MNTLLVGRDVGGLTHPILTNQSGLLLAQVFWDPVSQAVSFNGSGTLLASAERNVTTNSPDQPNYSWRGGVFIIDVTDTPGPIAITLTVEGKDPVSGKYYSILTSAAITAVGMTVLRVGPELTAAANLVARDILPPIFRVVVTHPTNETTTYSVAFNGVV